MTRISDRSFIQYELPKARTQAATVGGNAKPATPSAQVEGSDRGPIKGPVLNPPQTMAFPEGGDGPVQTTAIPEGGEKPTPPVQTTATPEGGDVQTPPIQTRAYPEGGDDPSVPVQTRAYPEGAERQAAVKQLDRELFNFW